MNDTGSIEAAVLNRRSGTIRVGQLNAKDLGGAYTAATILWDRFTELLRIAGAIGLGETVTHLEFDRRGITYVIEEL